MNNYTVYLLREDIKTDCDAIAVQVAGIPIVDGASHYGTLFVKPTAPREPKWSPLFTPFVDKKKLGYVQSSAAVLIVPVDKRLFAVTFGQGRHLLKPEAFEERFGLLVTLNSVRQDALRSVDKRAFVDDQNSRVQTSQASAALEFGIDIERDLIRGIVGYPDAPEMGRRLSGSDALNFTSKADIPELKRQLRRYLRAYSSTDYKEKFPWVDQVRQLRPKGQRAVELDALLVEKLKIAWQQGGRVEGCWLAIPDVVDWTRIAGFKFTRKKNEGMSSDLHLPGLVQAYPDAEPSIEFLRSRQAFAVDEEQWTVEDWQIYRCIHCELEDGGKSYVLSAGNWFEVHDDFAASIEEFYANIAKFPLELPIYNHDDEAAYNQAIVDEGNGAWCLMDRKLLNVGGVHDKVEFCDVYGAKTLLHIKHYGSSSVLGHLFNQGLVSAELLKSDKSFVQLANEKIDPAHALDLPFDVPRDVTDYKVVFRMSSA
ncbi:DUF6119 family protein [Stenotrophomonas maltophilia]|uniref:DUF6119 family protein n=1 Tax=Stenotrophomonas maltophilia TaxID=40324 RepID=UPI0007F935EE|nr:DUF6119 family protein [Stenotrophomonas maltophilia]OBU57328.1 hypothetical protein A9K70_10580 [Stenotrophomonas maltophilia]